MSRVLRRRLLLILLAVVGGILGLVLIGVANVDRLARGVLVSTLHRQTGAGVRLDAVRLGFRDASFSLSGLVLSNPPQFSARPLLSIPELYMAYHPESAASNAVRFREVRLHLAELNLEVDARGRTNVTELAATAAAKRGADGGGETGADPGALTNWLQGMTFEGIDRLTLSLGRISYSDQRDPRRDRTILLGITNRTVENVTNWVQLLPLALEIAFKGGMVPGLK
ncbi:MAG: hypothetical protein J0L84_10100 [Verrucomicrobia bacterium]|nr:hypothetical protein [Verrucomicrobiota bacterium]